jgi:hypothetical protein
MRKQASDFAVQHPDQLAAAWRCDPQELFGGQAERMLLVHRCDIVEAVEVADRLLVRLVLDQLFGAWVKKADVGIDAPDESPSSSSTRRSTPCADGSCGPKLIVKL